MVCLCFPFKNSNRSYWSGKLVLKQGNGLRRVNIKFTSVFHHLLVQKASTFSEEPHLIASVQVCTSTLKQLLQLQLQLSGSEEFSGHSFAFILSSCAAHNFSFPSIPVPDQAKTFIFIIFFFFFYFFDFYQLVSLYNKQLCFRIKSHFFFVWLNY